MGGGCWYSPFFSGMGGGFFPGGILSIFFWGLVIAGLVYLGIRLFRSQGSRKDFGPRDTRDSLEIVNTRYARGEISEEEYNRMRDVLQGS